MRTRAAIMYAANTKPTKQSMAEWPHANLYFDPFFEDMVNFGGFLISTVELEALKLDLPSILTQNGFRVVGACWRTTARASFYAFSSVIPMLALFDSNLPSPTV